MESFVKIRNKISPLHLVVLVWFIVDGFEMGATSSLHGRGDDDRVEITDSSSRKKTMLSTVIPFTVFQFCGENRVYKLTPPRR